MIHGKFPVPSVADCALTELKDRVAAATTAYFDAIDTAPRPGTDPLAKVQPSLAEGLAHVLSNPNDTQLHRLGADVDYAKEIFGVNIDPDFKQNYPQPIARKTPFSVSTARGRLRILTRAIAELQRRVHALSEAERNWRIAPTQEDLERAHTRLNEESARVRFTINSLPDYLFAPVRRT